ncbi:rRNA maturation RNase YbeY [Aurantimonas sp. C2-6-R+9]|uniref:rRNA maturation RNase YbeY n=1 Tax=unclassified Aurantimonas TaxID=2638230 RepID=UPI002E18712E|nr:MULTISPECIES: rRNA maturation RNase YbeY [unclassified Aurantimonas]MEC5289561.1 rRNA maturation RNase YbeY [Aurantimonas sp. C2-3-R2]MEC5379526.1 rRNA maturation RNase YbeY [Aurantimonas sp. C2-6-R+9]MEC5410642.1 rRNA maturation RNase YbeY [Aurantimonas sp. C2-4-R8]
MRSGKSGYVPYEGLTVALSIEATEWEAAGLGDVSAMAHGVFAATAGRIGLPEDLQSEIAVTLADDETVRAANAEWRGKDRPTNILSFPMANLAPGDRPGPLCGDLLLAFQTVQREARAEGKRLADHFRHLLVHGFLHLMGFDHIDEAEAEAMETLEIAILADLGIADPYRECLENPPKPVMMAD